VSDTANADDLKPEPVLKEKFQAKCFCTWQGPVRDSELEAERDARTHTKQAKHGEWPK